MVRDHAGFQGAVYPSGKRMFIVQVRVGRRQQHKIGLFRAVHCGLGQSPRSNHHSSSVRRTGPPA